MNCKQCNAFVPEGQKFCGECGAKVVEENITELPKENYDNSKPKRSKKSKKGLAIVIIAVIAIICGLVLSNVIFGKDKGTTKKDGEVVLSINVESSNNLLMSKYDIEIFVDDESVGTVANGDKFSGEISVDSGSHELKFISLKSPNVYAIKTIDINDDFQFNCCLNKTSEAIIISDEKTDTKINMPFTSKDAKGVNVDDIVNQLKEAGFINVQEKSINDLSPVDRLSISQNEVIEISVNGSTDYSVSDLFFSDSEIVVRYYK